MNPDGMIPSARSMHAVAKYIDGLLIFGGLGASGELNDIHQYSIMSNRWMQQKSTAVLSPTARSGSCASLAGSFIFIFGGLTMSGVSNELWIYSINQRVFKLINNGMDVIIPKMMLCKCFTRYIGDNIYFYITTGELASGNPNADIYRYDYKHKSWEYAYKSVSFGSFNVARAAATNFENYLVLIGGEQYFITTHKTIYLVDLDAETVVPVLIGYLDDPVYGAEAAYFKNSVYLFGGGDHIAQLAQTKIFKNSLYMISVDETDNFTWPCSIGTIGQKCTVCPSGNYFNNSTSCNKCRQGTFYNSIAGGSKFECYPCMFGTFASESGSSYCTSCPSSYFCPVGSITPAVKTIKETYASSQPNIYEQGKNYSIMFWLEVVFGVVISCIFLAFLFYRPLREIAFKFDLYDDKHECEDNQPIFKRKTLLGGLFSIIFVGLSALLTSLAVSNYIYGNIEESKTLAPNVSLLDKYKYFPGDINITIIHYYYGGTCEINGICVDIEYSILRIIGKISPISCKLTNNDCEITFLCNDCILATGAQFYVIFDEYSSYSSSVSVKVSSSSSIPDENSEVFYMLSTQDENSVFRGQDPTEFKVSVTPSLFLSDDSESGDGMTGNHLSITTTPISGSEYKVYE